MAQQDSCLYNVQLWGSAANSTMNIIRRFQAKMECQIKDAPWDVPNKVISDNLGLSPESETILTEYWVSQLTILINHLLILINCVMNCWTSTMKCADNVCTLWLLKTHTDTHTQICSLYFVYHVNGHCIVS